MAEIGLNVARDGHHDPLSVRALGATWVRIVVMRDHDLRDYFQRCRAAGLSILAVIARESFAGFSQGTDTLAYYRTLYGDIVTAWQVGNEADLASPSSWTMTQAELTSLGKTVRAAMPSATLVCAGMASGHPEWLDGMDLSWCDALAVHPYGKTPDPQWPHPGWGTGLMGPLLDSYAAYGKPLLVTEVGLSTHEALEDFQAEYLKRCAEYLNHREDVLVWCWFCISDDMV